jgi:hypothetical protein
LIAGEEPELCVRLRAVAARHQDGSSRCRHDAVWAVVAAHAKKWLCVCARSIPTRSVAGASLRLGIQACMALGGVLPNHLFSGWTVH